VAGEANSEAGLKEDPWLGRPIVRLRLACRRIPGWEANSDAGLKEDPWLGRPIARLA
jgi:hypothetical protein